MVWQTVEQLKASDPKSSVWVGASAGTGKTFVLSNRVLRLMLVGNKPDKILCLTYTNAAAAEMEIRVNKRLAEWISLTDKELFQELYEVLGAVPSDQQIILARKLFAQVLDVPGGLKIQTIHSFCQSLLGRFPIEAKVAPNFDLLDDITINEHLKSSQDEMLLDIDSGSNEALREALNYLSGMLAEETFTSLMKSLANERGNLEQLFIRNSTSFDTVMYSLKKLLGFHTEDTKESIICQAVADNNFDRKGLSSVASLLLASDKVTDKKRGKIIYDWLENEKDRPTNFQEYKTAYLKTTDDDFYKDYMTKNLAKEYPDKLDILLKEAERVKFINDRLKTYVLFENSCAILQMAFMLIKTYNKRKQIRNVVDYDDLISKVSALFQNVSASWILYKLDEGIDHILIDEAQDTNPEQWNIIRKLALEFFSGVGTRDEQEMIEKPRTIFAVGDVKQSIYSFQKAEPKLFNITREYFDKQINEAKLDFVNVPMNLSFRSTSAVLEVVDQVFKADDYKRAISFSYEEIRHDTHRTDEPGLIEIWPTILPVEEEIEEGWSPPIIQKAIHDPRRKVADQIADKIQTWINEGEVLAAKGRPITAGDILILVQKRNEFVQYMIRALKKRKINVAGLDQMVLTDQLAVMDLIAIAKFTLLPSDDLTLAIVLKSPFIGMSEEDLFELANPRAENESLWQALLKKQTEKNIYNTAAGFLKLLANHADFHPPFEFFSYLLGPLRGRQKLIYRLGEQCNDPVDEFLNQAMKYEQNNISSMQGFLNWIEKGNIKIKRDMEQGGDMVRIMTVHGAKGLQAPIVFLPDTCQGVNFPDTLFWHEENNQKYMLWVKNKDTQIGVGKTAYDNRKKDVEDENKRLLYVAMTRAEDRLYVTGWENKHHTNRVQGCWYNMIYDAVSSMEGTEEVVINGETIIRRKKGDEAKGNVELKTVKEITKIKPLPDWVGKKPPEEPLPIRPLTPSKLDDDDEVIASPLLMVARKKRDHIKYHRGRLIHKLLEILPEIEEGEREAAAIKYLNHDAHEISQNDTSQIVSEVMSIIYDKNLKHLFGPDSRSEVPIVGQIGSFSLSGQVDRLAVLENEILIIDYKTNRPPAEKVEDIPLIYVRQMAAYKRVLEDIYENRRVRSFLLWTDTGLLMEIPETNLNKIKF